MAESVSPARKNNPSPGSAPKSRRWPWWKRLLAGLGVLLLLVVLFHRQILFGLAKYGAGKFGAGAGLTVEFTPGGTIFTGLTLRDVRLTPTRPGAIEKANIGLLRLRYSLPGLIRGGLSGDFLKEVTLHDVDFVYDPNLSPPAPPKKKEAFQLPPLPFPEELSLKNINVAIRPTTESKAEAAGKNAAASSAVPAPAAPAVAGATQSVAESGLRVAGFDLELPPDRPGRLRVGELQIPGGPNLTDIQAGATYRNRNLELTNFNLDPNFRFRRVAIDGSGLPERETLVIRLDGDIFAGRLTADVRLTGVGKPPRAQVELDATGLRLAAARDFLKFEQALEGRIPELRLRFEGQSDKPRTWNFQFRTSLLGLAYRDFRLDSVTVGTVAADGRIQSAEVAAQFGEGSTVVTASGPLPENIADLPRAGVSGTLKINAPDFAALPITLPPAMKLRGAMRAEGPFAVENNRFTAKLDGTLRALSAAEPALGVNSAGFSVELAKALPADATAPAPTANTPAPPPQPFWDGLVTRFTTTAEGLRYANFLVDSVALAARNDNAAVTVERLDVTRGANRVHAEATYRLPATNGSWEQQPLALDFRIEAPRLAQFSADARAEPITGQLSGNGHVETQGGRYRGDIRVAAQDVAARGLRVQSADIGVGIENSVATLKNGRIVFDERNSVTVDGEAALQAPYPFTGKLNVDLPELAKFAPVLRANGVQGPIGGSLSVVGDFRGRSAGSGPGAVDAELRGVLDVTGRNITAAGARIEAVETHVVASGQELKIETGSVRFDEKNAVGFSGTVQPGGARAFDLSVNADLPELAAFESLLRANDVKQSVAGSVRLQTRVRGELSRPVAPAAEAAGAGGTALWVSAGNVAVDAANLRVDGARVLETVDGRIRLADNRATVEKLAIRFDEKNNATLGGQADIAAPFAYQGTLDANLTELRTFEPLLRALQARSAADPANPKPPAPTLGEPAVKKKPTTPAPKVAGTRNRRGGRGAPDIEPGPAPRAAAGSSSPAPTRLAGAVQIAWRGSGQLGAQAPGDGNAPATPARHTGDASVVARGVEFNALGPVAADVKGSYSPDAINFPTLVVSLNGLELNATLGLKNNLLRFDELHLRQGSTDLLAGYLQIPLDPSKLSDPAGPVPDVDAIDVNIDSKAIPIETLYRALFPGQTPPAQGTVALTVLAKGQLSKLYADVKVQGRSLRATTGPKLAAADADIALNLRDDRLNLDASVRQPQIAPLSIKGNIPLNLQTVLRKGSLDPASPVQLVIDLPRSDLGFLRGVVPGIRFVQGTALADIRVAGTIGQPALSGVAELNIPAARAENITVPAIRDLAARITFRERTLSIERFGVEVGGGKASASGRVDFTKLTEPTLDLAARADSVLVLRDDNITARINADVRINGPLASATVSGRIGVTKSRFLKDIDILPLNLPGKPAPAPPAVAQAGYGPEALGVSAPPLRDWKLDLAIKTDDPFLVRGNVANGRALVDLQIGGTGGRPLISGYVQVENLIATLPFSRLEIQTGNIQFTPDQPLNPVLDLRGTSQIRERLVTVFISGRARDPKTQFISEPPLPQADIVSLLATGATPAELTGSGQALAGKATLLVLQDLYRRTFKKRSASRNAEPQATLADRVDLNLGNVDPKTGKQSVGATFKINDQFRFIGDFGIEGDIRGRIKYLLRFR